MQLSQTAAENRLADFGMDDMPLEQIRPTPHSVSPDWFKKYRELVRTFATTLTDSVQELALINLAQNDFFDLITGRRIPENFSVRFRIPLIWGGKLEIENLFMCTTFPHSHNLDKFIIEQSGNDIIWLPNPAKKVYIPIHMANGGDGGNATEDRFSQLIAHNISGHGME